MDVQTITNTFSEDFNSFTILERKGRIPVLISLIRHYLATSWNHQKQRQTEYVATPCSYFEMI